MGDANDTEAEEHPEEGRSEAQADKGQVIYMGTKSAAYMRGYRSAAARTLGSEYRGMVGRTSQLAEALSAAGIPNDMRLGKYQGTINVRLQKGGNATVEAEDGGGYTVSFRGRVSSSKYYSVSHSRYYRRDFDSAADVVKYLRKRVYRD